MKPKPKEKKKLISRRQRGLRYPVEYVAAELGVDRKTMERRCEAAGFHLNGAGLTFAEAYRGLSAKDEDAAARRRKNVAEAEAAEIDTLNKRNALVFRDDHSTIVKDLAVRTRVAIEAASYIPKDSRHRLIKEVSEIKPVVAEASHK